MSTLLLSVKRPLLTFSVLLLCISAYSQEYKRMIEDNTYTVQEVRDAANAHFDHADRGKGSGYKQYKRWEYHALRHMNENGYLPSPEALYQEWTASRSNQSNVMVDDSQWSELGPSSWNSTSGWNPGVGRLTSLAIDPDDALHMIVGSPTGGIWKSLDGGATWAVLTDDFINMDVYALAMDPADTDTYYWGSTSGIIFRSTDAGVTWTELVNLPGSSVNKILMDPTDSSVMFCSISSGGIFRSTDSGATWSGDLTGGGNGLDIEFKPSDVTTVYASGWEFYRSTDGGATFSEVPAPFNGTHKMIGVSADDPAVVYVVEAQGSIFNEVYRSTDSGVSFVDLAHSDIVLNNGQVGINYFGYSSTGEDNRGQAPRDMDIVVNPANVDEVHIAGINTWRSMDGGSSFSISSQWSTGAAAEGLGYCHADVDMMTYRGTELYVCSDGGLYKATDPSGPINPGLYTDLTPGMGIRQFYKIGISQSDPVIVTGGSQDNGSSFYSTGGQWFDWLGADGMEGFIDKDNNNIFYGTSQNGTMYKSTNGGQSYFGLSSPPGTANWVTPFEQDPTDQDVIYCGYNHVYKSTNGGSSWSQISDNIGNGGQRMDHIKVAPSDNQVIYAAYFGNLYKTTDGGSTLAWTQLSGFSGSINSIAIHPDDADRVAIATTSADKVYVSTDGGSTWTAQRLNLPGFSALALVWGPTYNNRLYIGMDYGIYYIDNLISEWQLYANDLPNVQISELEVNTADGQLYASSYGRGLFRSPLAPFVEDTEAPTAPTDLTASNTISIATDLSWTAATDNSVVAEYEIFQDGVSVGTSPIDTYTATGLTPSTTYSFSVRAIDGAGNTSPQSSSISVTTTPPDLVDPTAPSDIVVSEILQTTAQVDWTAATDNVGVVHYNILVDGVEVASSTTTSYALTGLSPTTTYALSITAEDAVGNTSSAATSGFTTLDPSVASYHCASAGNSVADEYIGRVQIEEIDNTSDAQLYSDFSDLYSTPLTEGETYTITVTPEWTGTIYSEGYSVWIDYNADNDFDDDGEQVWTLAPTTDTPVSGTFTVPFGTALEEVAMRVSLKYDGIPTPCETFSYGEVEDYAIMLQSGEPDTEAPSMPTDLTANNTVQNATDLAWTASTDNVGVTGYEIFQDGLSIGTTTATAYDIDGLTPLTTYNFSVRAFDAAGNNSAATPLLSVTTTAPDTEVPTTPQDLTAIDITNVSASLTWSPSTDNVGVAVYEVYVDGVLNGSVVGPVNQSPYELTGLTELTVYTAGVRAIDAQGNVSDMATTTFTTEESSLASNYCASASTNVNDEYIGRVELESIDNVSDAQFYSDFSAISTELVEGSTYTISVTPTWTGTVYPEGYGVWIDYNGDFDFDDAGEEVWTQAPTQDNVVSGSFTVPPTTGLGEVLMRVSMKYNGVPTSCESFTFGEVEDYTIILAASVADTEPPTSPMDLLAANTTENTTDLSWSASSDNVGVIGYEIFQDGASIGSSPQASHSISGLAAATMYSFTVRAYDAAGNYSQQSTALDVQTLSCLADINIDGSVDINDMLLLNSVFGTTCSGCPEDLDNDGVIGINDFILFNSEFGINCDPETPSQSGLDLRSALIAAEMDLHPTIQKYLDKEGAHLSVFPNPNNGQVFQVVAHGLGATSAVRLEVVDVKGRLIHGQFLRVENGEVRLELSQDNALPAGLYLLRLVNGQMSLEQRVVVE